MNQKTATSKSDANAPKDDDGSLAGSKESKDAGGKVGARSQDAKSKKGKSGGGAKASTNKPGR